MPERSAWSTAPSGSRSSLSVVGNRRGLGCAGAVVLDGLPTGASDTSAHGGRIITTLNRYVLRAIREASLLSVEQLARLANLTAERVECLENGTTRVSTIELDRLAAVLRVKPSTLVWVGPPARAASHASAVPLLNAPALVALRERQGLNRAGLARKARLSAQVLSALELGQRDATPQTLHKLAEGLGVPKTALMWDPRDNPWD